MEHRLIQGGEQFLPFARSRIKALRATGLQYATQRFSIDGVDIAVRLVGDQEYIRITESDTAYLESGIQDLRNVLPAFDETYRPAIVRFTPRVTDLSGLPPDKLENSETRQLVDGNLTWSAAGAVTKKLIKTVDTYIGTVNPVPLHFENTEAVYCPNPDQVAAAKLLRETTPPSIFTGKLKLYVQALYGSKRTDYKVGNDRYQIYVETGATTDSGKVYATVASQYATSGLMLTPDGAYLLITIGPDSVTYRKMRIGTKFKKTAASDAHPAEAEVMTLAKLIPGSTVLTAVGTDMTAAMRGAGPIAYGWHFNKSGDTASIVTTTSISLSGVRTYNGAISSIVGIQGTHYTMRFTWADGVLSYKLESGLSGQHIPYLQTKIFTPGLASDTMNLMLPGDSPPWNCYADLGPCPVYCYYDKDDTLVVVKTSNSTMTTAAAVNDFADVINEQDGAQLFQSVVMVIPSYRAGKNKPVTYSFANNGVWADGVFSNLSSSWVRTGQTVNSEYFLQRGAPPGGTVYWDITTLSSFIQTTRSGESLTSTPLLVIPFGDASAVISGLRTLTTGTVDSRLEYLFGNNMICEVGGVPRNWNVAVATVTWGLRGTPLTAPQLAALPTSTVLNSMTVALNSYSNNGTTVLANYYATSALDGTLGFGARPHTALFEAVSSAPSYQYPMRVKTSYFGAEMQSWLLNDPVTTPHAYLNGWPTAPYSVPVGWA